jgi:hypothetical protein
LLWVSFFLTILGFKLRASHLLSRCSTTWPTPPAVPCFGFLEAIFVYVLLKPTYCGSIGSIVSIFCTYTFLI